MHYAFINVTEMKFAEYLKMPEVTVMTMICTLYRKKSSYKET